MCLSKYSNPIFLLIIILKITNKIKGVASCPATMLQHPPPHHLLTAPIRSIALPYHLSRTGTGVQIFNPNYHRVQTYGSPKILASPMNLDGRSYINARVINATMINIPCHNYCKSKVCGNCVYRCSH